MIRLAPPNGGLAEKAAIRVAFARRKARSYRRLDGLSRISASRVDPCVGNASRDAVLLRHFSKGAPVNVFDSVPLVPRLGEGIRPHAVIRRIALVVVDPLDREVVGITRGNRPPIEGLERRPFLANLYPAASISRVFIGVRVVAPRAHVLPCGVEARPRLTVRAEAIARCSARPGAPTTQRLPRSQVASNDVLGHPAFTNAAPNGSPARGVPNLIYDGPFADAFAGHIDDARVFYHTATIQRSMQDTQ